MGSNKKVMFSLIAVMAVIFIAVVYFGQMRYKTLGEAAAKESKDYQDTSIVDEDNELTAAEKKEEKIKNQKVDFKGASFKYSPIGDSLTAGFFASTADKKFTQVLSNMIEKEMNYDVTLGGTGSYGGILSGGLKAIPELNAQEPDLVSIEFGTNDCNAENNVPIDTFKKQLNTLIDGVTKDANRDPQIVLVTTWNQSVKCIPYDDVIKSVGEERDIPVADLENLWYNNPENKGPADVKTYNGTSDDFHPNDKGMKAIAETIFDKVEGPLKEKGLKEIQN